MFAVGAVVFTVGSVMLSVGPAMLVGGKVVFVVGAAGVVMFVALVVELRGGIGVSPVGPVVLVGSALPLRTTHTYTHTRCMLTILAMDRRPQIHTYTVAMGTEVHTCDACIRCARGAQKHVCMDACMHYYPRVDRQRIR